MSKHLNEFIEIFNNVKNRGFIETHRSGNTGIGKTFEDCCNIVENNLEIADYKDIEIKSQRNYTGSYITLFTKAPTYPKKANTALRTKYGSPDKQIPDMKVLHTSIFSTSFNTHKSGYGFKIEIDYTNEKIKLIIKDLSTNTIVDDTVYWSFNNIKEIIDTKLQYIAFIQAETKKKDGKELFHFNKMILLSDFTFPKFLKLLEEGLIMFDIRIGIYRKGKNIGKTHDHGSGFRISKRSLNIAFNVQIIE